MDGPKRGGREIEVGVEVELEIVKRFAELGYQVQPDVIDLLRQYQLEQGVGINEIAEWVAKSLDSSSIFVISGEQIAELIKQQQQQQHRAPKQRRAPPGIVKSFSNSGNSVQQGDFLQHFISRYEEIGGIIKRRMNSSQIRFVRNTRTDEDVSVVGMVSSVNKTARGNLLVDLEDPSGHIPVVIPPHNEVIPDEVIGVTGTLTRSGYLFAHRLVYPDVPLHKSASAQSSLPLASSCEDEEPEYALFISDMHVGSHTFREDAWDSFVDWLREEARSRGIDIGYLIVAGDIVDGIGVYPGQENDLAIADIEEQYKTAARCLRRIPGGIHVVLAPGNHDAVRSAEPQPPLYEDFQRFFSSDTCFVSNPAYIKIGSRIVLIYHGQSFDDFVNSVSRLNYSKPEDMMVEMLRRRHIAPIYGNSVSIIPDGHDYGVINPIPDILHCGHTHTVGIARYRDVLLINSGTWQSQTQYQKKRGISPVVGCATLVELSQMKTKVLDFGKGRGKGKGREG
ncbi:MAG: DNA-directed DNA polymerase II small subunit [Methanophagales archaeon]|nr:DNA-directed DNA polymerase II small subunit [Methanophagales archaeon]